MDAVSRETMAWQARRAMRGIKDSKAQGGMLALVVLAACLAKKVIKERRVRKESGEHLEVTAHVVLKVNRVKQEWKASLASKDSKAPVVCVALLVSLEASAPLVSVAARVTRVKRESKGVKAWLAIPVFKAGRVAEVILVRGETRANMA